MRRTSLYRLSSAIVDKFWAPFRQNISGYDLFTKYEFADALKAIAHRDIFTCQVNGVAGGKERLEDFFLILLCPFDIAKVTFVGDGVTSPAHQSESAALGAYQLIHRRPFLGWKPDDATPLTVTVPFTMNGEVSHHHGQLSHLTLRSPLTQTLRESHRVPSGVVDLLDNADAMKMLVTLRRARVKPEIISERALLSVSRKQDTWCSALGLV